MISDSITNASAKKKRNKSAKMKQNKLGLRREQWLSQVAVTNKECKEERREKPDGLRREEDDNDGGNVHHESFMESPSSSSMGGTNFSGRSSRSISSSSSSSSSEEDNADDDDGCVDDWEALADALEADEGENDQGSLLHESVKEQDNIAQSTSSVGDAASRKQRSNRAWRQDDNLRPQGLPNLAKQLSFPELDKRFSTEAIPSSCPICYEDLDFTDSCFLPCPCGFRICLFCHKTICDGDGRCPGCRRPYERNVITAETSFQGGGLTVRLTRLSSMFCRF